MTLMKIRIAGYPLGIWIAFLALSSLMLAWCMQAYSLYDWDSAVNLGLQNERFTGDAAERAWALESRGVALADLLWPLPLCIVAFIGLLRRCFYGLIAGFMALAVGVYFPLVFAFQRWPAYPGTVITAILLWIVPSLAGTVGLWINRDEFAARSFQ